MFGFGSGEGSEYGFHVLAMLSLEIDVMEKDA